MELVGYGILVLIGIIVACLVQKVLQDMLDRTTYRQARRALEDDRRDLQKKAMEASKKL